MSPGYFDGPTLTLIVNPSAGHGRARKYLPRVCTELLTALPESHLRVHQTTSYAEARLRTIAAVDAARPIVPGVRPDAVVVMGGDGMMSLGINACAGTDVPLGCIPAGTGNDFCRGIGMPGNPVAAARAIAAGETRRVDLLRVTGNLDDGAQERYVGSIVSTGFDARVNLRTNAMRWPHGAPRYAISVLAELATFEPVRYQLRLDGRPRRLNAMFIAVGNAGYFGGGMKPLPHADIEDGELDVTIVHPVSRATLLRLLPRMYDGGFVTDPAAELLRCRSVDLDGDGLVAMADGERIGTTPLRLEVAPRSLTVLVPGKRALGAGAQKEPA